ncbi:hypothetical protein KC878_02815 [Candidatus Saccharibacteria bacterium]|nr:hypothetical protein [Candidatus Saccharibacteria bacterium]MCB9820953.1 hypothetical protein [Candidatus Nomurabacteria bacterium]
MNINSQDLILSLVSLTPVVLLVLLGQFLWSHKILKGEYSRKFVHMLSATWIATWRFFLPAGYVIGMALAMGIGVYIFKKLKLFKSLYSVKRLTYGEVSYAVAIAVTAFFFKQPEVYFLAIINLGIGDGLAAIVGRKYGKKKKPSRVFGIKSFAGSSACFLFVLTTGALFWTLADLAPNVNYDIGALYVFLAAFIIASAELFADKGIDNLIIPIVTGLIFGGIV